MEPISTDKLTEILGRQRKDNVAASIKRAIASKELRLGRHYVEHGRKRETRLTLDGLDALDGVLRLSPEELVALTKYTTKERGRETKSSAEQAVQALTDRVEHMQGELFLLRDTCAKLTMRACYALMLAQALCKPDTIANAQEWANAKLKELGALDALQVNVLMGSTGGQFKTAIDDMARLDKDYAEWEKTRGKSE